MSDSIRSYQILKTLSSKRNEDTFLVEKKVKKFIIKKINLNSVDSEMIRARINEVKSCETPYLVKVIETFQEEHYIYVVFNFVLGVSLNEALEKQLYSPANLAKKVLEGFQSIKQKSFAHGDLSPSNIIISKDLSLTFIDPVLSFNGLTRNIGSFNFLAPELLTPNNKQNFLSDYFSICSIVYYILEGQAPFKFQSLEEYSIKLATGNLPKLDFKNTPRKFQKIILNGLEAIPEKRRISKESLPRKKILIALAVLSVISSLAIIKGYLFSETKFNEELKSEVTDLTTEDLSIIENVGKAPFYLRNHPTENELIVCNAHSPYLTVVKFEKSEAKIKRKIHLKNHFSHDIAFINDDFALVSSSETNAVIFIKYSTGETVKVLESGPEKWFVHPDAITISKKHNRAFVTSWKGAFVTVIDLENQTPVAKIPVFPGPSGLTTSSDGEDIFISHTEVKFNSQSNTSEGVVSVLSAKTLEVTKEIPNVGKASSDIKTLGSSPIVVATNFRGQSISYIDQDGRSNLGNISLNIGSPIDLFFDPNLNKIFIANFNHPYVHIVNNETKKLELILHSSYFGKEANGIILTNKGKSLCLTNTESNELVCIKNIVELSRKNGSNF
jgi:serine/threonine protein kinase